MEFTIYILQYLATPALVVAAVAWVTKQIALQALSTGSALAVERFRHEMQKNLEEARFEFNREIEAHKTRFARLQEKRLDPLLDLYFSISELSSHALYIKTLLDYFPQDDLSDEVNQLEELIRRAKKEYLKSLLFLPNAIAKKADAIIASINNAELKYVIELEGGSGDMSLARNKLRDSLTGNYDKETADLGQQLRFLLGVEDFEAKA